MWLDATERLPEEELHHHDIVHFALKEFERLSVGTEGDDVITRLQEHLHEIKTHRHCDPDSPSQSRAIAPGDPVEALRLNPGHSRP